ncbi:hypothetical protein ACJMK2_012884 [Sinanodonta woodiana]|uniref:Uncharacterized protein n=1 Tax=Sinanodonta woodiana TaxID=1069815 RepID=A0ABD3V9M7_SINWO
MAGHLKFSYICLSIFLLVLPLVCSDDGGKNGKDDMEELLQNLLKAEKERRQQSEDTTANGSGGNEQGHADDDENVPQIKTEKLSNGVVENEVSVNNELEQKIIQDCGNKYELILAKSTDKGGGSCYLHKMNDRIYQKDCQRIKTEGEIKIDYSFGKEIQNTTLLSSIKGIDGCMGKPVIELIETAVKKRDFDEYEKRLAEKRGCDACVVYQVNCYNVCVESSGWWWSYECKKERLECHYSCRYNCR